MLCLNKTIIKAQEGGINMKKQKLLELSKLGTNFEIYVPAGTSVESIEQAIALFVIDNSKYRGIKTSTLLAEITHWVTQLEENL